MANYNKDSELNELKYKYDELQKQYIKLYEMKSLSLIAGDLVISSRKSLVGILTLPIKLLKLRKKFVSGEIKPNFSGFSLKNTETVIEKNSILFMATNGVGLGHLTRCLAVARKLKKNINVEQIVFLTTCPALHLVRNEGFIPFYVPSKEMFEGKITGSQWDNLLLDAFNDILSVYAFDTIIFDGAIPYQSLAMVLEEKSELLRIWIRRGSAKKQTESARQKNEELFDYIIIPSELGDNPDKSHEKFIFVNPIVYLNESEQMSREDVRKFFGVSEDKRLIYVQLGAGKINDTSNVLNNIIKIILKDDKNIIVLGQSPLGNELKYINERIILLKDYPNSKYFKGFDLAVSACGYNSFHELVSSKVPTIYLPNKNTGTDDQMARAKRSEKYGLGVVLEDLSEKNFETAFEYLLTKKSSTNELDGLFNGSEQAAVEIMKLRNSGT